MNEEEEKKLEITKWLKSGEIPNPRSDPLFVERFLTGCKYVTEKVKTKMKNYHETRRNTPEWFEQRDPFDPGIQNLLRSGVLLPLPRKTEANECVIIVRATANDPRANPMVQVFKVGTMVVDLAMEIDPDFTGNGVTVVIDIKGATLRHALQMTPNLIGKAVHSWQDCYPIRIKTLNFVNSPPYVNVVLNIFKRFMREKLKKRIRIHGYNLKSLHEVIDKKLLPQEYGGDSYSINSVSQHWKQLVENHSDWYKNDVTVKN